jgi:hypothetical protein
MTEQKLTYWKFLQTNHYPAILLFSIAMLIVGLTQFDGDAGSWIWVGIFVAAILTVLIGGFYKHWKEYKSK